MRKLLKSFIVIAGISLIIYSCKKEKVVADFGNLETGTYLTLVKAGNSRLDYGNLATTKVDITVQEKGSPIEKLKIYVTKGQIDLNRSNWKAIKEITYANPTDISVSAVEIATALGIQPSDLETGAIYTIYNQCILKDGRIFDAANTNASFQGISNYNMALTWQAVVICPFVAPIAGTYKVIRDDWVDWSPGDLVSVTDGPGPNQVNLSAVWPNPAYGTIVNPLVLDVDPATGAATSKSGVTWGNYGSYTTSTGTGSSGYVFSCTGQINVKLRVIATGFGDQGFLTLILQKQ